jgi:hypothetical protein
VTAASDPIALARFVVDNPGAPNPLGDNDTGELATLFARAVIALAAERDRAYEENMQQASQLLDPDATCCADATRKTREMRLAHEDERDALKAERAQIAEQCANALSQWNQAAIERDALNLKCETLKREFHDVLQPENAALKAALREACDFAMCYCLCADTDGTAGSDIDRIAALRKLVEP